MKPNPAKKNRTRQATAAVLALALGAVVYLNWSFARAAPQDLTVGAIADGTAQEVSAVIDPLTDDTAVETAAAVDTTDTQAPTGKNYGEAQMVSVSKDSGAEFFESARLARTKARDEALDTLKKSLKDAKLSDADKKKLTEDLAAQVSSITLETKLETLIKSKGFADCVVDLEGEKANVTVMTENDALLPPRSPASGMPAQPVRRAGGPGHHDRRSKITVKTCVSVANAWFCGKTKTILICKWRQL